MVELIFNIPGGKIKKWILFLMFILAVQIGYKIAPVLGQNEQDAQEIKNVIDKLANSITYQDLDSAMSQVSMNYSCATCGEAKDYNTFKSILQEQMNDVLKTYTDLSINELQLNNLNIHDNNATVEVGFNWKGFNLDTLKEDSGKQKNQFFRKRRWYLEDYACGGDWNRLNNRVLKQTSVLFLDED